MYCIAIDSVIDYPRFSPSHLVYLLFVEAKREQNNISCRDE